MPLRLTERDERILRHIARYRLTTPEVVRTLFFPREEESLKDPLEAAKSNLRRFWKDKDDCYLASKPLYGKGRAVYYHLTPHGAHYLGYPEPEKIGRDTDNLDARAMYLGRLLFACGSARRRHKFTPDEFDACFPGLRVKGTELYGRFFSDAYYLDVDERDGTRRLGRILVDLGSGLVAQARRAVEQAEETVPDFLRAKRFALALVFATADKHKEARYQLNANPVGEEFGVRLVFDEQPALVPLLQTRLA